MAIVRVPSVVTGITMNTSGALVPDANSFITVTADEATIMVQEYSQPVPHHVTNLGQGLMALFQPGANLAIQDVTVNGVTHVIANSGTITQNWAADDATAYVREGFNLVNG